MKTRNLVKILCSLMISAMPTLALAQKPQAAAQDTSRTEEMRSIADDPIGEWIEKNAARYGLYVDPAPVKKKAASKSPPLPTSREVPTSRVAPNAPATSTSSKLQLSPIGYVTNGHTPAVIVTPPNQQPQQHPQQLPPAASASAPVSKAEQDAIEAFIVNRVIDVPRVSEGFAAPSLTGSSNLTGLQGPLTNPSTFEETVTHSPTTLPVIEKKVFAPPPEAAKSVSGAAQVSAVMTDLDYADKCSSFATPTGFGVWGKAIIQEVVGGGANTLLQGTDDLRRACPNYDFLTVREKSHVWVNILASMSFLESSCDPRKLGKGPNGTAAGLLQLHAGRENEAAPGCNKRDSSSPITSLLCGISIIETQIKRTNALFSRDTHFGVLRPQGDLIRTKAGPRRVVKARVVAGGIRELPICQRTR